LAQPLARLELVREQFCSLTDMSGRGAELVLGSASPRRRALLQERGVRFTVEPADVDETLAGAWTPEAAAREVALRKARALLARHAHGGSTRSGARDLFVLCADTVVGVPVDGGWRLLAKAADRDEARDMLRALSGTTQSVCTGLAVARCSDGALFDDVETTFVTMRALSAGEIESYLDTDEWRDKAGAYGIQGRADRFVVALAGGGFDNVVGLPVERALRLLERAGLAREVLSR
jgi:septum formation protein